MAEFGLWADTHIRRMFARVEDEEEKAKAFRFMNADEVVFAADSEAAEERQRAEMMASAEAWASQEGEGVRE